FITGDDLPHVLRLAHRLRETGFRVEYALSPQSVGKQLGLANDRGARYALVIGPDERSRGEIIMKDLHTGSQEAVPLQSSVDVIRARIHG
ncbi:MAG TPA: His/Gly/Thr/Pro-type tRNA ligase C-terminal domain-containing protein, partial [Gemmatimonadales bacterium]